MGPLVGKKNNTVEKEKAFLAFIDNVFPIMGPDSLHRGIQLLKDGRIICYCYSVKIYKYIDKNFILDFEFGFEPPIGFEPPESSSIGSICEIEDNIILIGCNMKLYLYDIWNKKFLQKISFTNTLVYFTQCIRLSNGLIATSNRLEIIFYKYDDKLKKLLKVDEIKNLRGDSKIFEIENGNIISYYDNELIIYNQNRSIQTKIIIDNHYVGCSVLDGEYLLISHNDGSYLNSFVDVYSIKKFKLLQTLGVKYKLKDFVKLNNNLLVASDENGNIQEFSIDENHKLSAKDIFRAHEWIITGMCKFDDNKLLSISFDGKAKLWEFN